jgi:hypothetical protein
LKALVGRRDHRPIRALHRTVIVPEKSATDQV